MPLHHHRRCGCKRQSLSSFHQTTEFADAARRIGHLALAAFPDWSGSCRLYILWGGESMEPPVQKSRDDQPYKLTASPSSQTSARSSPNSRGSLNIFSPQPEVERVRIGGLPIALSNL